MEHVNEIVLVGRLSGEPEWKALPGGGRVAVWRVIVEHPGARSPQDSIDTIRCVAFQPAVQEGMTAWRHGDLVEVRGSLRHRFWRGPAGPRGLYEVEAATAIRHRPADAADPAVRPDAAAPAGTASTAGKGGRGPGSGSGAGPARTARPAGPPAWAGSADGEEEAGR